MDMERVQPGQGPIVPPMQAFRRQAERAVKGTVKTSAREKSRNSDRGRIIVCRACGFPITQASSKIEMNGKHKHTFSNPRGYVFQIGCFASARGIMNQGEPTTEFTWFSGFAWKFSLCFQCFTHLGWFFQSSDRGFYGLILDNIIEIPVDDDPRPG